MSEIDESTGQVISGAARLMARLHSLLDELAAADMTACSDAELVEIAELNERALARVTFQGDRQIVELSDRNLPHKLGYRNVTNFMNAALRVSDPARRTAQMTATAAFRRFTGEPGDPECPTLAAAFADGMVGHSHVREVLDILSRIPHDLPHDQQVAAEATMAELATKHTPKEIGVLGARMLAHLDPDGELTDDTDRQRKRTLWLNKQNAQKMSKLTGHLTPVARARLEMMLAVWAKPGMNNPEDPDSPLGSAEEADPDALAAAASRDMRTQAQRNHDALDALLKAVFEDGMLGASHRGLPVQLIIKIDESDLREHAGLGTTATGALLPIHDVVELAATAQPWLAVFADHSAEPLYLGRARLASRAQRLASFARPDGEFCSHPDCDQPAAHVEIHHATLDYAKGGLTNIGDLAPACPTHNRRVGDTVGQYTTGIYSAGPRKGRCWWQLNTEPGAPPNPKRVDTLPDVQTVFTTNLDATRTQIHRPPTQTVRAPALSGSPGTSETPMSVTRTEPATPASDGPGSDMPVTGLFRDSVRLRQLLDSGWSVAEVHPGLLLAQRN